MEGSIHTEKHVLDFLDVAHCADVKQITRWLTGDFYRDTEYRYFWLEKALPRMVLFDEIVCAKYGARLVYVSKQRGRSPLWKENGKKHDIREEMDRRLKIKHALACTEGLIRVYKSSQLDHDCIIPERVFKGMGAVPEWAIRYKNGNGLCFEHSTSNQTERPSAIKNKVIAYKKSELMLKNIPGLEMNELYVLFVLDVSPQKVAAIVEDCKPLCKDSTIDFRFVDAATFLAQPHGHQMSPAIYIYGANGEKYPLGEDNQNDVQRSSGTRDRQFGGGDLGVPDWDGD